MNQRRIFELLLIVAGLEPGRNRLKGIEPGREPYEGLLEYGRRLDRTGKLVAVSELSVILADDTP